MKTTDKTTNNTTRKSTNKPTNDWKSMLAGQFADELKEVAAQAAQQEPAAPEAAPQWRGTLRVELDKHGRKGKPVTLVTGFGGTEEELARLTRLLQTRVGAGGSHCFNSEEPYDGQILIQGDARTKVGDLLTAEGYKVKVIK
jgi:translation initiation factor 1